MNVSVVAFFVLLLASTYASLKAIEVRRALDPRAFRISLVSAIPLWCATLAMVLAAGSGPFRPPNDHFGFGLGWHCLGSGPKGGGFCIKDPATTQDPDAAAHPAP